MFEEQIFLREIRQGNKDAFNRMFLHFYSPLCEYASQFVPDDDAEELVQDMMLYVWESREHLVVEKSLKSYLFVSLKNRCFNALRNRKLREQIHHHIYEKLKDRLDEPDYYIFNELAINLEKAIEELPESYRETFKMSRFGEMSNAAIANELGISIKTVEYRVTQSLKILRVQLKDYLVVLAFLWSV